MNPPHGAIGSRIPREHLPPSGLLAIGGPLIDAGHDVSLLNADLALTDWHGILDELSRRAPKAVLIGHSGSTSAHPMVMALTPSIRSALPGSWIVYGGVYPTFHWRDVLAECPEIDAIVRGEGEETTPRLLAALESHSRLDDIRGIAFHGPGGPVATPPAVVVADLDAHRIGWELINFDDYTYWGGRKSVILQFSRGCPHLCTYCGQRGFWTRWRHRDPARFAAEIARLVREHGVELINLADENPTSSRRAWRAFLEALIAEDVRVTIVGSTRASDIVRDADVLHLYKRAGVLRFLLGMENTDEATLERVCKGSTSAIDREAIRLMRAHGMIALCTWVVGFEEETDGDYLRVMRQLLDYDPDQIMSVFATPHCWTPFFAESRHRRVIQTDRRLWDYKHQVLETRRVPAWRVFLWVKLIETRLQLRPKALWRAFCHPDREIRHAMRWYTRMGRRVFLHEVLNFLLRERRTQSGPTLAEFWGSAEPLVEYAHDTGAPADRPLSQTPSEGRVREPSS